MNVVCITSMKGGVGKTTITANLAVALARQSNHPVIALDFAPQNSLHLYFKLAQNYSQGISSPASEVASWRQISTFNASKVSCYPFGDNTSSQLKAFEAKLAANPDWLRLALEKMGAPEDSIVLIDTPPGPSTYLEQALNTAHLVFSVLIPDAASYATIPLTEAWFEDHPALQQYYLINQADRAIPLYQDTADVLRARIPEKISPTDLHRDEGVCDALAFQEIFIERYPHSQTTYDIHKLAEWLHSQMISQ